MIITTNILGKMSDSLHSCLWYSSLPDYKKNDILNSYCSMMRLLNSEQQELIIRLTEKFKHYALGEYECEINKLLEQFPCGILSQISNIFIVPVSVKKDCGKSKSGSTICNLLKPHFSRMLGRLGYPNLTVEYLAEVSALGAKKKLAH